jgi:hypothetical protein
LFHFHECEFSFTQAMAKKVLETRFLKKSPPWKLGQGEWLIQVAG